MSGIFYVTFTIFDLPIYLDIAVHFVVLSYPVDNNDDILYVKVDYCQLMSVVESSKYTTNGKLLPIQK